MTIHQKFWRLFLLLSIIGASCASSLVLAQLPTIGRYNLVIQFTGKDTSFNTQSLKLQTNFTSQIQCADYINQLPSVLLMKGFISASIDKVVYDSTVASVDLYIGTQQKWVQLKPDSIDKKALDESGFDAKSFTEKPVNFIQLQLIKERLLTFYENNGYPFAAVYLDSISLIDNQMAATLKSTKGPLYHVDSIRVFGKFKISNFFLQRYLGVTNGSVYNTEKLEQVSKRLLELPFLQEQQPSDLTLLGTGSVLNLYLQPKKNSQINFLIGFLPANNQTDKLQLTGDIKLDLKNSFGLGENILLSWQQLQVQSPRLNIGYQQPYIFRSSFGLDFGFDLFKKDTTFLQLNTQLGIQYLLSAHQSGKLFFQNQRTILLGSGVDTNQVRFTKTLPPNVDVSAINIGIDYEWNQTNYRRNPVKGNEIRFISSVGIKTIKKNNDIVSLKDPSFNYGSLYDSIKLKSYQVRVKLTAAHYFPLGKRSTLKANLAAGVFSAQNIFRNELFQIGGYKLLRGFDEEGIFATRYAVATAEFRSLVGLNSYLFTFIDAGWVQNKYQAVNLSNNFVSAGIGLAFETKLGLLNLSLAVGKRDGVNFDLRKASKIHFGYINYF